jgi:ribosomal protein S12 methylthiotransferase accessory factor YcaO
MNLPQEIRDELKARLALCHELLQGLEREGQALRRPDNPSLFEFHQLRKKLLPALNRSLEALRRHRVKWQQFSREERARHPEIGLLLRQNQDLTMKVIILDRENEQSLLRRGLVPARELPSVNRQRPHFVADLYRRQSVA